MHVPMIRAHNVPKESIKSPTRDRPKPIRDVVLSEEARICELGNIT
jgi:hypothetical protein